MTAEELRDLLSLAINRSGMPLHATRIVEDPDGLLVQNTSTGDAFFLVIAKAGE